MVSSLAVLPLANLSDDADQQVLLGRDDRRVDLTDRRHSRLACDPLATRACATRAAAQPPPGSLASLESTLGWKERCFAWAHACGSPCSWFMPRPTALLWSGEWARPLEDLLLVQSEIARAVAREVRAVITPDEARRFARVSSIDPRPMTRSYGDVSSGVSGHVSRSCDPSTIFERRCPSTALRRGARGDCRIDGAARVSGFPASARGDAGHESGGHHSALDRARSGGGSQCARGLRRIPRVAVDRGRRAVLARDRRQPQLRAHVHVVRPTPREHRAPGSERGDASRRRAARSAQLACGRGARYRAVPCRTY